MHSRGTGHPGAGFRNRPYHDRGIEVAEARAAIGFGNADAKPAGIGERLVEVGREATLLVPLQPIGVVEPRADLCHGLADRFLIGCESKVHAPQSFWAAGAALVPPSRTTAAIPSAGETGSRQNSPTSLFE